MLYELFKQWTGNQDDWLLIQQQFYANNIYLHLFIADDPYSKWTLQAYVINKMIFFIIII